MRQRVLRRVRRKALSCLHLEALEDRRVLSGGGHSPGVHPSPSHAHEAAVFRTAGPEKEQAAVADGDSADAPQADFVGPVRHAHGGEHARSSEQAAPTRETLQEGPSTDGEGTDGPTGVNQVVNPGHGPKGEAHSRASSDDTSDGREDTGGDSGEDRTVIRPTAQSDAADDFGPGRSDAAHADARRADRAGEGSDHSAGSYANAQALSTSPAAEDGGAASLVSVRQAGPVLPSHAAHPAHAAASALSSLPEGQASARATAVALGQADRDAAGHEERPHAERAETSFTAVAHPAANAEAEGPSGQLAPPSAFWTAAVADPDRPGESAYLPFLSAEEVSGDPLALVGWRARQEALAAAAAAAAEEGSLSSGRHALAAEHLAFATQAGPTLPGESGLASGLLTSDTGLLHQAIRHFLGQLDAAGRELTRVLADNTWIRWVVAAALAALAADAARRRLGRSARTGQAGEEDDPQLSGLSGSYPFPTSSF